LWANPLQGPLEGVALVIETFLGPERQSASAIWAQNSRPPPPPHAVQSIFTSYRSPPLKGANPLQGPLEGEGSENRNYTASNL
jgi:hypothetical protein